MAGKAGTATPLCPHCRQPFRYQRAGVDLTPLKAAIFDSVAAAGDEGVASIDIAYLIYRDRPVPKPSLHTIKAHVQQINELLLATDVVIVSDRRRWFMHGR